MIQVPRLQAVIQTLRLTAVVRKYALAFEGAIVIDQRLAWAAGITELQWVEVRNLTRCHRLGALVLFGDPNRIEWWSSPEQPALILSGDAIRITAFSWATNCTRDTHTARLVKVDESNAPIEIRKIRPRSVLIDPTYFPLGPRTEDLEILCKDNTGTV